MTSSLVGSEMCIRDSYLQAAQRDKLDGVHVQGAGEGGAEKDGQHNKGCLLYTSTLPTICSV
eukprot:12596579-Prorocentrum_lima.AAC.1